jgi:hypothetical protein
VSAAGFGADRLGWPDDVLAEVERRRLWAERVIEKFELTYDASNVRPVGFPTLDATGDRVGTLRYDPTGRADPKMLAEAGSTRELFPPPETIPNDVARLLNPEGEPDTVAAWSADFAAVGVPGVEGWKPEDAGRFSGRRWTVYPIGDCDKVGRAAARKRAGDLVDAGVDARVIELDASRDDGYDLTDFLLERGRDALEALLDAAELYEPPAAESDRPWRSQAWSVFREQTPERQRWLVEGLLPAGALVFLAAPPKKGKTWLGVGVGLTVATGLPLAGEYDVGEPRDVLYVALEGSNVGLRTRIGALARGLDLDPEGDELERLHMLYRPRPFDLVDLVTATWLHDEAAEVDAALVVVDVLRAAARTVPDGSGVRPFNENAAGDFTLVRDALEPLLAAGRTVLLLHHFGKLTETQKERSPGERMAGTGAMYGAFDVGLLITGSESGARRMRVDVEARDFAAPDALGIVILGTGSGEHGGFTYTDTATLALDESAVEGRDYVAELEALFEDGEWRTETELASKKQGIAAGRDEVKAALEGTPERFVQITDDGRRVGRGANARPWGTRAMFEAIEEAESLAPGSEQVEQDTLHELEVGRVVAPTGQATTRPPQASGRAEQESKWSKSRSAEATA